MVSKALRKSSIVALAIVITTCLSLTRSVLAQEALGSRVNGLISLDVSDHYITPRGLNVENQGVVAEPLTCCFGS